MHTESGGASDGLRPALERKLRTVKLDRAAVYEYLLESLPALESMEDDWRERDARALTEYLRPTERDESEIEGPDYQFSSARHKRALITGIFRRLAARRPLVLWLDDLQWGREALGVLEHLAEKAGKLPDMLVLATVRSDLLREQPTRKKRLDALRDDGDATAIAIDPLPKADQRELLSKLLPLDDELADRLAERTEGHPLSAMQLLGHWIERDALEIGGDGFHLPEDRQFELPESIHQIWIERLRRLIRRDAEGAEARMWRAIEMAAALGRNVAEVEWRAVCERMGVADASRFGDRLVERGLAERTDEGWAFAHGLMVESIAQKARERGRWEDHHRRCANLLEEVYTGRGREMALRRARHYVRAGNSEAALEPFLTAYERFRKSGDQQAARQILAKREDLMDELGCSERESGRIENATLARRVELQLGREEPEALLEPLEVLAHRADDVGEHAIASKARESRAHCLRQSGDQDRAVS